MKELKSVLVLMLLMSITACGSIKKKEDIRIKENVRVSEELSSRINVMQAVTEMGMVEMVVTEYSEPDSEGKQHIVRRTNMQARDTSESVIHYIYKDTVKVDAERVADVQHDEERGGNVMSWVLVGVAGGVFLLCSIILLFVVKCKWQ